MDKQTTTAKANNPFRLDDLLLTSWPTAVRRPLLRGIERMLGLTPLAVGYDRLPEGLGPMAFANATLNFMNVQPLLRSGSLGNIPRTGATVVVANHPFGGIEGVIMARMLKQVRPDVRIMANGLLRRIPELSECFIGVNPYGHQRARKENIKPLREALSWLKGGGMLLVFPAGDVSRLHPLEWELRDDRWDASIARLVRFCQASVVPVYFEGRNSLLFHALGLLQPRLRSLMLARELWHKRNARIGVHIGHTISYRQLENVGGNDEIARYLRLRTYLLGSGAREVNLPKPQGETEEDEMEAIIDAIPQQRMREEIEALPLTQQLTASGALQVYVARSYQIPWTMQEIGRLREITFRAVGEGSGKPSDIDLYDSYYLHLFIWNREAQELVGAYRLGLADEIHDQFGKHGLYSYSLFRYSKRLLRAVNPAIELGRSFVRVEYQRSFTPLMLLWKGIGQFVQRNPRYSVLFGPVSISNDYSSTSQQLLIDFLTANNFDNRLGRLIRPRSPYRGKVKPFWRKAELAGIGTIDNVSELVAMQEEGEKGVPVLIKQYLKLGGRMLGFNVDRDFNDCIDGLILVDLLQTDPKVLQKYMGREGAEAFLAYHRGEKAKQA